MAAALACPVLQTYRAKGIVPETAPYAAGVITGATIEAPVLRAADLVVAIGFDPVELIPAPWPYPAPLLALSEWPLADPYFRPAAAAVGPLAALLDLVAGLPAGTGAGARQAYLGARDELRIPAAGLAPYEVVDAAAATRPAGGFTVDAGAHMLVAMALLDAEAPDTVLVSSGLATMGFALPAAIAAALARPGRRLVCLTGDGGLGMALAELETLARLRLPVTVLVFDDAALSLIAIKQRRSGQGGAAAVNHRPVDLAAVAAGFGVEARRATTAVELAAALEAPGDGPLLVDAVVDPQPYRAVLAAIRGGSR
jgi:acetolactate synthase-1/2/3 large subunit